MDGKHYGPAHPDSGTGRLDESGEGISYIYGGEGVIAQRIPNKETPDSAKASMEGITA